MDLTDEAKAEIQAAIKILREDGVHIHKTYAQFLKSQQEPKDPPADPPADPANPPTNDPTPPPPTHDPTPKPEKKGLWWGDRK